MFQRFFEEGLAQASFLIGSERTKKAIVIDPRRDASIYTAAAARIGMPHQAFSTGTLRMPPPIPSVPDT